MRVLIQRVKQASVEVNGTCVSSIEHGFLLFVGFKKQDTLELINKMVAKIINLRIFEDDNDKLNRSIVDVKGAILSISQFTLYADCHKGNRPSFSEVAKSQEANDLYKIFNDTLRNSTIEIMEGVFQADMKVQLINDGPVTILLDSEELGWEK